MADSSVDKKPNFFVRTGRRFARWLREMRSELKKVVWPSFKQVVNNSIIVIVLVIIVGVFTAIVDAGFNAGVRALVLATNEKEPSAIVDTTAASTTAAITDDTTAADTTASTENQ